MMDGNEHVDAEDNTNGLQFYRCVLCGHVVSKWDIAEKHGCPKCRGTKIKPSNLSTWEQICQMIMHPRVWKWCE